MDARRIRHGANHATPRLFFCHTLTPYLSSTLSGTTVLMSSSGLPTPRISTAELSNAAIRPYV